MSFLLTFSSLASPVASGLYGTLLAMIVNIRRSFLPVAGDMLAYCGMSTSIVKRITCWSLCWK